MPQREHFGCKADEKCVDCGKTCCLKCAFRWRPNADKVEYETVCMDCYDKRVMGR